MVKVNHVCDICIDFLLGYNGMTHAALKQYGIVLDGWVLHVQCLVVEVFSGISPVL